MKNANGYGSVYKLKGRRSRPWVAMVSLGRDLDGKLKRRALGYFRTKKEAQTALGRYNAEPYSLEGLTFKDVYEQWSAEHFPKITEPTALHYDIAFRQLRRLHGRRFSDLRTIDLENAIRTANSAPSSQRQMKTVCVLMYRYALRYDFAQRNYAENVIVKPLPETEKRRPFTDDEIACLFRHSDERIAQVILIAIYSGWRSAELCTFTLEGDLMRGGVKTKSGKNRIVPVHPRIAPFINAERYEYSNYRYVFRTFMERLGWNHTPHDTRRTFATLASRAGMDEHVRKLLLGHAESDLTERVYTTHTISQLREEIAKIP